MNAESDPEAGAVSTKEYQMHIRGAGLPLLYDIRSRLSVMCLVIVDTSRRLLNWPRWQPKWSTCCYQGIAQVTPETVHLIRNLCYADVTTAIKRLVTNDAVQQCR